MEQIFTTMRPMQTMPDEFFKKYSYSFTNR